MFSFDRKLKEKFFLGLTGSLALLAVLPLFHIIYTVTMNGLSTLLAGGGRPSSRVRLRRVESGPR